jgi:aspartate kinase
VPDALQALAGAGVEVVAMQHQIRNVDVQFVVHAAQFDMAVQALHRALVEEDTSALEGRRAA